MHTGLSFAETVGIITANFERGAFDAGLVTHTLIDQITLEPTLFSPAHVGSQEHFSPILGISTAHAGFYRKKRIAVVILTTQQHFSLECVNFGKQRSILVRHLVSQRRVVEFDELSQHHQAVIDIGPTS